MGAKHVAALAKSGRKADNSDGIKSKYKRQADGS